MLVQIMPSLYVGDMSTCSRGALLDTHPVLMQPHATVHAVKSPCHQQAVGYRGTLPQDHPHYLTYATGPELYLNMIDPPQPLFQLETFWAACEFMAAQSADLPVVVHCNLGLSRAPTLAFIRLVRLGLSPVSPEDYAAQHAWFTSLYPFYAPGAGLALYLKTHWQEILNARPPLSPAT
jgi:hypothetical protein